MTTKNKQALKGFAVFILAGIAIISLFVLAGFIILDKEVSKWKWIGVSLATVICGFLAVKAYRYQITIK